ncbi:MAG TPA: hypothetical protein VM821_07010 [Abditibacteriaceae bacterium]|nr:hypothetical protein [Abditibacteriaceae bacterium]
MALKPASRQNTNTDSEHQIEDSLFVFVFPETCVGCALPQPGSSACFKNAVHLEKRNRVLEGAAFNR